MVQQLSAQETRRSVATTSAMVAGAVVGAGLLTGAVVLWIHYGTAVFFEMIASGIAACI